MGFTFIMDQVGELVERLIIQSNVNKERVKGVGVAIAGLVNKMNGNVEFSPDFGWMNVDVRKSFYERLSLPFIYDNSSRLMALGEHEYGKGRNYENFVVVNVGYGIAAGIVVNGIPMTGSVGYAGELGHIIVDGKSKVKCRCGAMGCLEALASGRRIAQLGQEAAERMKKGPLFELCQGKISEIDARMVGLAAENGDPEASAIFQEITSYLSIGIATIANLLDPQIIFIGGGVSFNGNVFFENIRYSVKSFLISPEKSVSIVPVTYGENASVIGAISLITSKITNFEPLN
jgi:glucokinase-like ROK family protein